MTMPTLPCVYCPKPVDITRPGALLWDGVTAAHRTCHERAEAERRAAPARKPKLDWKVWPPWWDVA